MNKGQKRKIAADSCEDGPAPKRIHRQPVGHCSQDSDQNITGSPESVTVKTPPGSKEECKSMNYYWKIAQQSASMQRPKVFLTLEKLGVEPKQSQNAEGGQVETKLPPLFIEDLQGLLIFAVRRGVHTAAPRWCRMLRPGKMASAVLVVLKDVSDRDFHEHKDCFPFLDGTFSEDLRAVMVNPCQYFSTFDVDMYAVPVTEKQRTEFAKKHGDSHHRNGKKALFDKPSFVAEGRDGTGGALKCNRTHLLLNAAQMMGEKFPMPHDERYSGFVMSKEKYSPVTPNSPMFAVDCEMCLTARGRNELARVSIVNEQNEVVYDELVKPYSRIVNYLTRYSGITKKMLDPVTKRIEDVQQEIRELLPSDAILCGQSLHFDLVALEMIHPYVIDTSVIYNLSGNRGIKCGLKRLTWQFLGQAIQTSGSAGHCSAEDAGATMQLVQLKLSKDRTFGDTVLGGTICQASTTSESSSPSAKSAGQITTAAQDKSQQYSLPCLVQSAVMMRSLFDLLDYFDITACLIGQERLVSQYEGEAQLKCVATQSDKEAGKMAAEVSKVTNFTWVEMSSFTECVFPEEKSASSEEKVFPREQSMSSEKLSNESGSVEESAASVTRKRKVLKKLDKYLKNLLGGLQEKCLVAVVMTGRSTGEPKGNALTFLHIT